MMKNIQKVKRNINRIIKLVENTDLKYKDIAETLEVDISTLSRWVRGKHIPTRVYHDKIAEIAKFGKKVRADKIS
ncbi:hypothetical protein ES708_15827 [subsurface metagenome]